MLVITWMAHATTFTCYMDFGYSFTIHLSNVWLLSFVVNGEWCIVSIEWGVLENTRKYELVFSIRYHSIGMSVWMRYYIIWLFGKLWACSSSYLFVLVLLTGTSLEKLYGPWRNIGSVSPGLRFIIYGPDTTGTNNGRLLVFSWTLF